MEINTDVQEGLELGTLCSGERCLNRSAIGTTNPTSLFLLRVTVAVKTFSSDASKKLVDKFRYFDCMCPTKTSVLTLVLSLSSFPVLDFEIIITLF